MNEIVSNLLSDVEKLYRAFYRTRRFSRYGSSKITVLDKFSLAAALEDGSNLLEDQEIIQIAESYLDYLRGLVENIGRSVELLRAQVERDEPKL